MRRRDFVKGIVGSTVFRPLAARAQQTTKLPTIGFKSDMARAHCHVR
jgi:hypothetical protein